MKTSERGIALITSFEKLRLHAYVDTGGVWTIGYGHTRGVREGDCITTMQATHFMIEDLANAEHDVTVLTIDIPLTQSMFDALVSLVFNIGYPNFAGSTLLKFLQTHQYMAAAGEFMRWRYDNKKELMGLARRRAAEAVMFLTEDQPKETSH
jgi:lysozyme